jgi:cob(I)alamin adenosyltransferase
MQMHDDPTRAPETPLGRQTQKKGLVVVNTGNGKGKTTAALGMVMRAWGRNMRVTVVQFFKNDDAKFGEHRAAERMGIEFVSSGDGFTWLSRDLDESAAKARHGWAMAQERIASGQYDVVVLDEITYAFNYGWIDLDEALTWLEANKPPMMHLIITGRNAPDALIEYADLVTEMREIKHPYNQGVKAQPGIEF